jgi:hypothetical protein
MTLRRSPTSVEQSDHHAKTSEGRSYEVMEVVDQGVTWTPLDHEIEGHGKLPVRSEVAR